MVKSVSGELHAPAALPYSTLPGRSGEEKSITPTPSNPGTSSPWPSYYTNWAIPGSVDSSGLESSLVEVVFVLR